MQEHFLSVKNLTPQDLYSIIQKAIEFKNGLKVKQDKQNSLINLFFENSTRTIHSFETAAKSNDITFYNFNLASSSVAKGESVFETFVTIAKQNHKFIIIRLSEFGELQKCANYLKQYNYNNTTIINAGDGKNEHPTQALGDLLSIIEHFNINPKDLITKGLKGLKVAIVGDIFNSRVARSNIYLLTSLGASIRVVTNPLFYPLHLQKFYKNNYNVDYATSINQSLQDCDVVMTLRFQTERFDKSQNQTCNFSINDKNIHLLKQTACIMHPGPINSGFEITDQIAIHHPQSLVVKQVGNCTHIRSAILNLYL